MLMHLSSNQKDDVVREIKEASTLVAKGLPLNDLETTGVMVVEVLVRETVLRSDRLEEIQGKVDLLPKGHQGLTVLTEGAAREVSEEKGGVVRTVESLDLMDVEKEVVMVARLKGALIVVSEGVSLDKAEVKAVPTQGAAQVVLVVHVLMEISDAVLRLATRSHLLSRC